MARINYTAIRNAVKTQLDNHADVTATVEIERQFPYSPEVCPWVGVYLLGRTAPEDWQVVAAGKVISYNLTIQVVCAEWSLESMNQAITLRDTLLGNVEIALMSDRTLQGTVNTSWLEGGDMPNAMDEDEESQFLSMANIEVTANVDARI